MGNEKQPTLGAGGGRKEVKMNNKIQPIAISGNGIAGIIITLIMAAAQIGQIILAENNKKS
ncbi:MAG: hypothetical protein ABIM74_09890 [candidate division WOR-3 bacterium]